MTISNNAILPQRVGGASINIEDELVTYMRSLARTSNRKIEAVLSWYGLRGGKRLTLEEIGDQLGVTRARAQQMINGAFRTAILAEPLPVLAAVSQLLSEQQCIRGDELLRLLSANGITWPGSMDGLLVLLHEANLCTGVGLYTASFQSTTRGVVAEPASLYLGRERFVEMLRRCFKEASDLPGQLGIANLRDLAARSNWPPDSERVVRSAIKASGVTWFDEQGEDFWYVFETRSNTLFSLLAKVFAVIDAAEISQLGPVLSNALRKRSQAYEYPSVPVIESYLRNSVYLIRHEEIVTWAGREAQDGTSHQLAPIERDTVQFLSAVPYTTYPALKEHLQGKGYGDPAIVKATMSSALVQVDRSAGRQNYLYRLVPAAHMPVIDQNAARYAQFLAKLGELLEHGTDEEVEGTRRKEQGLLQDWLFAGKKEQCCAMCGRTFSVGALVTAHKKRRADCVAAERLDPHIVMPLCTFGCDYLYERGYVYFDGFEMVANQDMTAATADWEAAQALAGRSLHSSFRAGGPKYLRGKPAA